MIESATGIELGYVTEFEASVLLGALHEFAENWPNESASVQILLDQILPQLPSEWENDGRAVWTGESCPNPDCFSGNVRLLKENTLECLECKAQFAPERKFS